MNAKNLPGIFRLLLCFTVIYSMLAWCSDIAASDNAQRPYVPSRELPAILQSTPEEVAREILIGVASGFMDFPEGKVVAEWHEFQNSAKVLHPAYKELLTRHSLERLSKSFPNFDSSDRVIISRTGQEVVLRDYSRIYKLRFPSGADIGAICEELKGLPGVLFAEPNGIVSPGNATNTVTPSDGSLTDTQAMPAAPTNFAAAASDGQVALSWSNPNNATITKYQYHHIYALEWTDIPGSGASTTGHTVTGLTNGTLYAFQVRAVNAGGDGAASANAQATPVSPCDFNNDGAVDQTDTDLFMAVFGLSSGDPGFDARMDFDGNGTIDYEDFFLYAACYNG